jgi:nitrogen fixation NifU-like protein
MDPQNDELWQTHSDNYLKMAFASDKREVVENPDGYGKRTGECGDTIEIFITVRNNSIQHVSFDTNGCLNTTACANTVAYLAEGKNLNEAWELTPDEVVDYLETLPADHNHCAELAVGAFYLALSNFEEVKRNPWKKAYLKK